MPRSPLPPVAIGDADPGLLAVAATGATDAVADIRAAIAFARALGPQVPLPGDGRTAELLSVLATVGAVDLTVARVLEPHLDALGILSQAGAEVGEGVYGVFAAERPGLDAVRAAPADGGLALSGRKPWCSLAGSLDRALITATQDGGRRLFDIDLDGPGASAVVGSWAARGLAAVDSGDLELDRVPARPVGAAGWYLERPGFAWGGIGVAACWFGGAVGLAQALLRSAARRTPDQLALAAIGETDRLIWSARTVLADAATRIDAGRAVGVEGSLLAARVRGAVAETAERIQVLVGHALGPAPLTFDEEHARRAADLTVYLRQHHAARDDAHAASALLATADDWA